MNKAIKSDTCLNCNSSLKEPDNFCPNCGQENRDWKVPLKDQLIQFLGDYFTFDSKLFKSTFYLLFKPGFLTNEFNSGKRVRYIPPLRMYIFISIIFFFVVGITHDENEDETDIKKEIAVGDTSSTDTLPGAYLSLGTGDISINSRSKNMNFSVENLKTISGNNDSLNAFLDTLGVEKTKFKIFVAKVIINQTLKLKEQHQSFSSYYMKNASIMMFFLMPLFAVLLKLFYIRRKKFYFEHLIFSFHLHSFAFTVLSVSEICNYEWVDFTVIFLILLYLLISMKKVYLQSWRKTFFKYFISLFSYVICLSVCILATIAVSFLLF